MGHGPWPVSGDAAFYSYQFARMGELGGRWWRLGQDELVGAPYQPEFGKHPGVFEGVDLLMVSTLTGRWLDPVVNYHALMILVMTVNGWVVGGFVRKLTGSWAWAALGVILVTWNFSTAFRLQGHAHLFKYGWTVVAVAAFSRYLDRPTIRRGTRPAGWRWPCAARLVLPRRLLGDGLRRLVAGLPGGRQSEQEAPHRGGRGPGLLRGLGLALTFPVWSPSRTRLLTDAYGGSRPDRRMEIDRRALAVRPAAGLEVRGIVSRGVRRRLPPRTADHGRLALPRPGHPPGDRDLRGLPAAGAGAGRRPTRGLLDRFMGLTGILVLFSLAGGPSFFLASGIGCFRAYGRAGLLAMALWCVAAPVILQAAFAVCLAGRLRRLAWPA